MSTPYESNHEVPCRDTFLSGILAQADPNRRSKAIALILHGQMAHKNQIYHRKLVKALAENRGIDSFRFDFAHAKYNQPGWVWHMAKIERDVEEMREVVLYLEQKLGYKVDLIIAHSKGGLATWRYLASYPDPPRYAINLSSRYDMKEGGKRSFTQFFPAFEKQGYYDWKAKVAGQEITVRVTPDMFEEFIAYDTAFVNDQTRFPNTTNILVIHGDADTLVPLEDGKTYHQILSRRPGPGTNDMRIVKDADHNFIGKYDEIVDIIMRWLDGKDIGIKGKL
ncbi:alpha/beta-hydrolase [Cystobasidium minutum MCA 4210]|uniref:alpha/beta-hydrolase n=1 Tax=Cystobasidium minutum MCA 4210 TaxID=1397322 RepID=UPI0034CDD84E|eukprot:jgi/Rhomi1/96196/CE96195_390